MTKNIKRAAAEFRRKYRMTDVNEKTLCDVLQKQGYTVIEFKKIINDENVAQIIDDLKLADMVACHNGFTYASDKYRLVFVNEDLSEFEKTIVLAHEAGHIFLEHMFSGNVLGLDVVQEHQANEFAHYLLYPGMAQKTKNWLKKHKKLAVSLCVCVLLIAAGITAFAIVSKERTFSDYYISATGNKYHIKNCIFVKNKDNVRRLTKEEFESGEYEPCHVCMPHGDN